MSDWSRTTRSSRPANLFDPLSNPESLLRRAQNTKGKQADQELDRAIQKHNERMQSSSSANPTPPEVSAATTGKPSVDQLLQQQASEELTLEMASQQQQMLDLQKSMVDILKLQTRNAPRAIERIRADEIPKYEGPWREPRALQRWFLLLEQFARAKAVSSAEDLITLMSMAVLEDNAAEWLVNNSSELQGKTWLEIKKALSKAWLPVGWEDQLEKLLMRAQQGNEDFDVFCARLRGIQKSLGTRVSDLQLAKYMINGFQEVFQARVEEKDLLAEASSFKFIDFETTCTRLWNTLKVERKASQRTFTPRTTATAPNVNKPLTEAEKELYKAYMRENKLCHVCKEPCGRAWGTCTKKGPFLRVPAGWKPKAVGSNSTTTPTVPSASGSRTRNRVAGLDDNQEGTVGMAKDDVAVLTDLDNQLDEEEKFLECDEKETEGSASN